MDPSGKKPNSPLRVMDGVEQPGQLSERAVRQYQKGRKKHISAEEYVAGIRSGDRAMLGRAITLVESTLHSHQAPAQEVISACLPLSGHSMRIGISGVPGVGKSTFIETFGKYLTGNGHKVAVLAIDPSSRRSGGSILGDKTRMEQLAIDPNAFIRPSPSAGTLGGVARKTMETLILCEAAGFDIVIVETVGVGQSETAVHGMVDFFLLLMLPGAGDELQGIKRGIIEMADAIIVNKADGDQARLAQQARAQYAEALHLFPLEESGWAPPVATCSALKCEGIAEVWDMICSYRDLSLGNGSFMRKRNIQARERMISALQESLQHQLFRHQAVKTLQHHLEHELAANRISPYVAAQLLLEAFMKETGRKQGDEGI